MANTALTHLEYCTYCPKMCRHACPVSEAAGRETWIPQAKMDRLNQIRKGNEPWAPASADPLWACTGCGHCTEYCVHGVEPGRILFAGRAEAQRRGAGHAALDRYPERFRAREERLARTVREGLGRERFSDDARVALWPGCDAIDKGLDDVRAQLALTDRLGADHVRIADTQRMCGGYPLLASGHPDVFRWHATRVAAELKGFSLVILNCSACVFTLRRLYPAEGIHVAAEILHASEYFERLAQPEQVEPKGDAKKPPVYYHDPCYLARYEGIVEEPRRLLARVAEVKELSWHKKDTECCGGGGMLPKTMPVVADDMARRRLREVAQKGGGTVVTSCGTCKYMLARNAPQGVEVRDLVEYVRSRVADPIPDQDQA